MKLYSTNNKSIQVNFQEAVFQSLPQDKGLYMPTEIPFLDKNWLAALDQYSFQDIAKKVSSHLLKDDIPENNLNSIIEDVFNFEVPLNFLEEDLAVLELFHGPSLAFKDFGARFMSRIMGYFAKEDGGILDVLVATSGDTGGAVALGFLGVKGVRVTILYPKGKVSPIQELQLISNGSNIRALEIEGTFDDCQSLVKAAFLDEELKSKLTLTSANSINIARLIPQSFYYFYGAGQAKLKGADSVTFVVPSGNFGNIGAGILATKMGLDVKQFIAATNANDVVPRFLKSGVYDAQESKATLSNAMDVGNPSNWVRIMEMFQQDQKILKEKLKSKSYTDEQTLDAIQELYYDHNYIACPHTAIAWLAAKEYQSKKNDNNETIVFLSTAHPCKFPNVFPDNIAEKIIYPEAIENLKQKEKHKTTLSKDFNEFKKWMLAIHE